MSTKQINILNELNDSSEMLDLIINQLENNKYNLSTIDYSKTFSRIEKYLWAQKYYNTHKFILFTRIILDNINSIKIDNDVIGILIESADILHSLKLMGNDVDSIFKDEEYIFTDICIYLGKILYKNGLTLPHKEELNNLYKDMPVKKPVRRIFKSKTQNKQSLKEEISSYNQVAIAFDERAKMIVDYKLYLPNFGYPVTDYFMYLLSKEKSEDTILKNNYNINHSSTLTAIQIPIIPAKLDVITIFNGADEFSFLISDVESILSVNASDIIQDRKSRKIFKHNIEIHILDSFSFLEGNLFDIINSRQKLVVFKHNDEHYGILCTGKILKSTISSDMLSLGKRNEILYEFSDNSKKSNYVFDINSIIDNYKNRFIKSLESTKAS